MPNLSLMIKPVSGLCDMRCRYCFYADVLSRRDERPRGVMTEATLRNLTRRAFAYSTSRVDFAFQGGEPTLAGVDFFKAAFRMQREYGGGRRARNAVQTNGLNVSDELLDVFARENVLLGVSLDATADIHDALRLDARGEGTYARAERTISRARERGIDVNVLCVVGRRVARLGGDALRALSKYGYVQFIPRLDGVGVAPDAESLTAEDYLSFLKDAFDAYLAFYRAGRYVSVRLFDNFVGILLGREPEVCAMRGACAAYYVIESDGSAYPCDFYATDAWKMGDINESSFFRLAASPVGRAFRERSRDERPECARCPWRALCGGGCAREREPFVAGRPGPFRFCGAYRSFFEYAIDGLIEIAAREREAKPN